MQQQQQQTEHSLEFTIHSIKWKWVHTFTYVHAYMCTHRHRHKIVWWRPLHRCYSAMPCAVPLKDVDVVYVYEMRDTVIMKNQSFRNGNIVNKLCLQNKNAVNGTRANEWTRDLIRTSSPYSIRHSHAVSGQNSTQFIRTIWQQHNSYVHSRRYLIELLNYWIIASLLLHSLHRHLCCCSNWGERIGKAIILAASTAAAAATVLL